MTTDKRVEVKTAYGTKRITFTKWEENIRAAKQFVTNYDKVRWKIATLAMEVCDITMGGRKGAEHFSVANFARAIELERKTLHEWIRAKRIVVDKLPKKIQDTIHTYQYQDVRDTMNMVTSESSEKEVYSAWAQVQAINPEVKKFTKYQKHMKSVLYNVERPFLMSNVPTNLLNDIIETLERIIRGIKKELELREKFSKDRVDLARFSKKSVKKAVEGL